MKLTPAEQFADHEVFKGEGNPVPLIRQIQADALRWAAEVTGGRAFRVDAYRVIHDQADQLHPKSKPKNPLDQLEIHPPHPNSPNC